jgi:hypothetical protein
MDRQASSHTGLGRSAFFAGAGLVLVMLLTTGISACLETSGQRREELRTAVQELVPPESRIRANGFGDCVELASSPSCAGAVFELPQHASGARARAVRAAAVANGWTVAQMDDAEGGWMLYMKRGNLRANVFLWRPEVYHLSCSGSHPDDKCFNTADVERSS